MEKTVNLLSQVLLENLIDKDGYRRIRSNETHKCGVKKYVLEHRLVVEKRIGRNLLNTEDVHHINHNRLDNRIENLMVLSSRSAHRRLEEGKKVYQSEIVFNGGA